MATGRRDLSLEEVNGNQGDQGPKTFIVGSKTSGDAILIDPGQPVWKIVKTLLKNRWKLKAIFLSCGDLGRAAHASEMRERFQVPLYVHRSELLRLHTLPAQAEKANLCGVKIPQIDGFVKDGDVMKFGEIKIQVTEIKKKETFYLSYRVGKFVFPSDLSPKPNSRKTSRRKKER